jgi:preprotein translocase subunit SecA
VGRGRRRGWGWNASRVPWLALPAALAAAAFAAASALDAPLPWQLTAAVAAAVVPTVFDMVRELRLGLSETARLMTRHLRATDRRGNPRPVASIRDLAQLGVVEARNAGDYVPRDKDGELDALLDRSSFVLVVGESKSGKTRTAAEAVRRRFPERRLVFPRGPESIPALLDAGIDLGESVIWLDRLENFLPGTALTALLDHVGGSDAPAGVTIVGTMQEDAYADCMPSGGYESPDWPNLRRAAPCFLSRIYSDRERTLAAAHYRKPELLAVLGRYSLPEYLTAGPDLHARHQDGLAQTGTARRPEQVGAVAVFAAADWSRTGLPQPVPPQVLADLTARYLAAWGLAVPAPGEYERGLRWALHPVYGAVALLFEAPGGYLAFDYGIDHNADRPDAAIVDATWTAALDAAEDGDSALRIGLAANRYDRLDVAVRAFAHAVREATPETLPAACFNYALAVERQGEAAEAETYYVRAADAGHIEAAHAAGRLLQGHGAVAQAVRYHRIAADRGNVESSYALGVLLLHQNPDEALRRLSVAADQGHADAAYQAGLLLRARGNTTAAARFFRIAAENSQAAAGRPAVVPGAPSAARRLRLPGGGDALRRSESVLAVAARLESAMAQCTEAELRRVGRILRHRLAAGESLDTLAPEAFAALREAARRVSGLTCSDEVLLAGAAAHHGLIAQLRPQPGRLLALALPAYLRALAGTPVHVICLDEAAARRGAERLGPVLEFLGVQTGLVVPRMLEAPKRLAYAADVVFGTLEEFAFDYLRDHRAWSPEERVQGEPGLALVAHADLELLEGVDEYYQLTDEVEQSPRWFTSFARIVARLERDRHYRVDTPGRRVDLTDEGLTAVEDQLGVDTLYSLENMPLIHYLDYALKAKELVQRDVHYAVRDNTIVVLEPGTGQPRPNSHYDDGMRQAVEAKEGLPLSAQSIVNLRIPKYGYLRRYPRLGGLATAVGFSDESLRLLYGVEVARVPPQTAPKRTQHDDWFFLTDRARRAQLVELVAERSAAGQPVLVDAASAERARELGSALTARAVAHRILSTLNREQETEILGEAGYPGRVTVAVNAHLSLVHIPLGGRSASPADEQEARAAGGLLVIGEQRHVERWRDDRLRELAARDGEPGAAHFLLATDDPTYQGAWAPSFAGDGPIHSLSLNWGIEARQRLLASVRADELRRRELAWFRVEEEQRLAFFALRERVLEQGDISALMSGYLHAVLDRLVARHVPKPGRGRADLAALDAELVRLCGIRYEQPELTAGAAAAPSKPGRAADPRAVLGTVTALAERAWAARAAELGAEVWAQVQRRVLLSVLDREWPDHLAALATGRDASSLLAAVHNSEPLAEYEREAAGLFADFHAAVQQEAVGYAMNLSVEVSEA